MELSVRQSHLPVIYAVLLVLSLAIALLQWGQRTLLEPPLIRPSPLPPLSSHALKHKEAEQVWRFLNSIDTRFCRYECGDRVYYACKFSPHRWAFAVVVDGVVTITAFLTDYDYAMAHTRDNDRCRPFIAAAHP